MPRTLEIAIREAIGNRGVSVVVIPGDVALQPASSAPAPNVSGLLPPHAMVTPVRADLDRLAELLNGNGRITVLCGSGCAGAHDQLLALGGRLKAPMVHALQDRRRSLIRSHRGDAVSDPMVGGGAQRRSPRTPLVLSWSASDGIQVRIA
jgi:thiamine pyrophosphate-dependent acetolactate synthase large subunit-like protein